MARRAMVVFVAAVLSATGAYAQEAGLGPPILEVTVVPAGGMFFVGETSEAAFNNYALGGSVTYAMNRFVAVEGELGASIGLTQDLTSGGLTDRKKTPSTFQYNGNVLLMRRTGFNTLTYVTSGIGALTMLENSPLAVSGAHTFLAGNFGGGVKWYANRRWGLRGDYRLIMIPAKTSAPGFFGRESRHGHRVSAGVVLNVLR